MKIAVFLPNWIGDVVMATPALRALRMHYVDAEIVAIHRPYVAEVLAGLDLVNRSIDWDPKDEEKSTKGVGLARKLRAEKFDIALLLPNSVRSAWMAYLSGAKRRVGFKRDLRSWLLTDSLEPKPKSEPHPVLDEYLRLTEHLGCRTRSKMMELATSPDDVTRLREFFFRERDGLPLNGFVCLNPGGAFGAAKHWPTEYFARLARQIAEGTGKTVLVLCGPAERLEAARIAKQAAHREVFSLANEEPSIGLTKAAVRYSRLLVTTDSGPRHFAPPFGIPVVTLFGPTHIEWSETNYAKAIHIQRDVDCGPCQERVCPLQHHKCMKELNVETVYAAALTLLRQNETRRKSA